MKNEIYRLMITPTKSFINGQIEALKLEYQRVRPQRCESGSFRRDIYRMHLTAEIKYLEGRKNEIYNTRY